MVNLQALRAFMRKEWLQTLRDPRTRMIVFVSPLIQLVVFGYVATLDVRHLRLGWVLGEEAPEDRALVHRLVAGQVFDDVIRLSSPDAAVKAFREGRVDAVWIRRGAPVLWVQGVHAQVVRTVLQSVPRVWEEVMTSQKPVRGSPPRVAWRVLYNPELQSAHYMLPGVALMIVLVGVALLSAVALTREKERGTYELLQMTPLRPQEIILGKVLPYATVGWINAQAVLILAHLLFGLPLRGSPVAVSLGLALYVSETAALALWVSTVSRTQQQAMFTVMGFMLPMVLFSGLFFPIESMPPLFQFLAEWNPLTHALRILRNLLLGGFPWQASLRSYLVLLGYALGFGWLGARALRHTLS